MTPLTLVFGASAGAREEAIATRLAQLPGTQACHIIVEGLAGASPVLAAALAARPASRLLGIAAACPCCAGNLVLRVTLNRLLRPSPAALFIALADGAHAAQLRDFLEQPPYASLLALQPDLDLSHASSRSAQSHL